MSSVSIQSEDLRSCELFFTKRPSGLMIVQSSESIYFYNHGKGPYDVDFDCPITQFMLGRQGRRLMTSDLLQRNQSFDLFSNACIQTSHMDLFKVKEILLHDSENTFYYIVLKEANENQKHIILRNPDFEHQSETSQTRQGIELGQNYLGTQFREKLSLNKVFESDSEISFFKVVVIDNKSYLFVGTVDWKETKIYLEKKQERKMLNYQNKKIKSLQKNMVFNDIFILENKENLIKKILVGKIHDSVNSNEYRVFFIFQNNSHVTKLFTFPQKKLTKSDKFEVRKRDYSLNRKTPKTDSKCINDLFYLIGYQGVVLVFLYENGQIDFKKWINKTNPVLTCYSDQKEVFLITYGQTLEIWDSNLDFIVFVLNFDSPISLTFLSESPAERLLIIYDDSQYHEFDLDRLDTRFSQEIVSNERGLILPMNLDLLPASTVLNTFFFKEDIIGIHFICKQENLDLFAFPFKTMQKCLDDQNIDFHAMEFAHYYFKEIKKRNFVDDMYGPLSPLNFAVYLNDLKLLEKILSKFRYPREVRGYWSPLGLAIKKSKGMATRIICEHLLEADHDFRLTTWELGVLLDSEFTFCHDLVSKVPRKLSKKYFSLGLLCQTTERYYYQPSLSDTLSLAKKTRFNFKRDSESLSKLQKKSEKMSKEKVIDAFLFDVDFGYQMGTPESVILVDAYSRSESEQFIDGEWKQLIQSKADSISFLHVINLAFYLGFTAVITLLMIFFPKNPILYLLFAIFNSLLIFLEVFKMISFRFFRLKRCKPLFR